MATGGGLLDLASGGPGRPASVGAGPEGGGWPAAGGPGAGPAARLGDLARPGSGQLPVALRRARHPPRKDLPDQAGATGGGVLVGGVVERLDPERHRLVEGQPRPVALLQRRLREQRAGTDPVVVVLLVAPAGHVEAED